MGNFCPMQDGVRNQVLALLSVPRVFHPSPLAQSPEEEYGFVYLNSLLCVRLVLFAFVLVRPYKNGFVFVFVFCFSLRLHKIYHRFGSAEERLINCSRRPQPVQQNRQFSRHRHDHPLLGILSSGSDFRQTPSPKR